MNKLRQSFRRKKDVYVPESSRPHQWQTDEEAVRTGKCSFANHSHPADLWQPIDALHPEPESKTDKGGGGGQGVRLVRLWGEKKRGRERERASG